MKKMYPHSLIASIQNIALMNCICPLLKSSLLNMGGWGRTKQMQNVIICFEVVSSGELVFFLAHP